MNNVALRRIEVSSKLTCLLLAVSYTVRIAMPRALPPASNGVRMRDPNGPKHRTVGAVVLALLLCVGALAVPTGTAVAGDPTPIILLEVGLIVVSATEDHGLDYEVLRSIVAADDTAVTFVLRRGAIPNVGAEPTSITRIVEREDLAQANRLVAYFHPEDPQSFPGSTATQASTALFEALARGEASPFVFGIASGPLGLLGSRKYYRGDLQRVEPTPVPMPVLLNGVRTLLPSLHVRGTIKVGDDIGEAEFWWLNQADNAMALRWTFKESSVQVIRIDTPTPPPTVKADQLGADLASDLCRAELHGIYFDTGSAVLLPQSEAEIVQVAALATAHPEWQLTIEGHTDSQGSDADNLVLSKNRAEAVLHAMTEVRGIAADRLTATGFGEARPVESNDTLEGRARNRRVELARQCP